MQLSQPLTRCRLSRREGFRAASAAISATLFAFRISLS